jgi:hypothetical protein
MARFEQFWVLACDYRQFIWLGVMMALFLLILTLFSLLLAPVGSASFAIALVNLVMTLGLMGAAGGLYWTCVKREQEAY